MSLSTDDHQPARRVLVATQFLDLGLREIGLFDLLAERRLVRHDAAHLTLFHARAELNVGAPAGHVRGDGDRARLARLRHDLGLALVLLRVEHFVPETAPLDHAESVSDTSTLTVPTSTGSPR